MCDYSLERVRSRAAKVGDELVSSSFANTMTKGFCDANDRECAVCLLPGTELAFAADISKDGWFGNVLPKAWGAEHGYRVARFRHLNEGNPHTHHDTLELPDGTTIAVTHLAEGQRATVIQLPSKELPEVTPADTLAGVEAPKALEMNLRW